MATGVLNGHLLMPWLHAQRSVQRGQPPWAYGCNVAKTESEQEAEHARAKTDVGRRPREADGLTPGRSIRGVESTSRLGFLQY